nr:hypothetical protein BaRGS_008787 [Batillaria attramentaria]
MASLIIRMCYTKDCGWSVTDMLTALILWTFTTGYGGVANCLDPRYSHAIVLVVGTSLSGLLSFIALMIYVGKLSFEKYLSTLND